jgi:hypothetical protein
MVTEAASSFGRRDRTLWYLLSICLAIYVFSAKGYVAVPDTGYSIRTAQAIVDRGQLGIPYGEGGTLKAPDGRSYSKYGIGLPLYFVPIAAAGNGLSRMTGLPVNQMAAACHTWIAAAQPEQTAGIGNVARLRLNGPRRDPTPAIPPLSSISAGYSKLRRH